MDKQALINRLLELPSEIAAAEDIVLQEHMLVVSAKESLQQKEDSLLLGNVIDGKNAEIRAAQVRQFTEHEREALADAEMRLKNAVARLGKGKDELRALRAVADLLKGAA
ncbi:hypothetical protein SAMN04487969_11924 [Paenibacillus algorifonticola]|uniref:Uncharacterized protein n=1 Tax=Paenibacillus algorifonticola TaxID=684063 RepID=A0A1I2H129_9BACL|nr:hypothetical protein [Paenibacillus algorifonticola]SFF22516.1 hypothetical protein SAMN04487969_11924 [Paenibacillus algorifonticola]